MASGFKFAASAHQIVAMNENPCPKCRSPRKSLSAKCSKCGWLPPPVHSETPEVAYPLDASSQVVAHPPMRRWRWLIAWIAIASVHFLIVWWSVENTSSSFWIMEGQPKSGNLIEEIAAGLTFLLNLPLGWVGFVVCMRFKFDIIPGIIPWVAANSLLWSALILAVVLGVLRIQRYRRSVLG